MFQLKPIHADSIPRALLRAERYRLLNEPREAESICRDVLAIDPENHEARVCLVLALTDLFSDLQVRVDEARPLVAHLPTPFERCYYAGVVEERWAKALHAAGYPRQVVFDLIRSAMNHFELAQALAPEANDDAVLRWNACVRLVDRHSLTGEHDAHAASADSFDDDVPVR